MQKIKNEKGITLVVLVITVIVLGLISIPTTLKINDIIEVNKLTKYKDDLTILAETVTQVYPQDSSISGIGPKYNGDTNKMLNPNDNEVYYIINLEKLNNDLYNKAGIRMETLNYGEGNYDLKNNTEDVYIINEQSRTIYYVAGFEDTKGKILHSYPENYTEISIKDFTPSE